MDGSRPEKYPVRVDKVYCIFLAAHCSDLTVSAYSPRFSWTIWKLARGEIRIARARARDDCRHTIAARYCESDEWRHRGIFDHLVRRTLASTSGMQRSNVPRETVPTTRPSLLYSSPQAPSLSALRQVRHTNLGFATLRERPASC